MKILITGIIAAIVLTVVSALVLTSEQTPTYEAYSPQSIRIGDPGHNLVGPNWGGDPTQPAVPGEG